MGGGLAMQGTEQGQRFRGARRRAQLLDVQIETLSDYLTAFRSVLPPENEYWFRGHGRIQWKLTPSALRYPKEEDRNKALGLLRSFKRVAEIKLSTPPPPQDELKWMQLAQQYGLPTRLLDWTSNAAIALYFACQELKKDGLVFLLNPADLNRENVGEARVLDALHDAATIKPYLSLGGQEDKNGLGTIAINPVLNSERIVLQRGRFTLHGAKQFSLDKKHVPSLVCLPVPKEVKRQCLAELEGVGVDEMSIFPEPEHACNHLRRSVQLPGSR